jgi:hypothetical protein
MMKLMTMNNMMLLLLLLMMMMMMMMETSDPCNPFKASFAPPETLRDSP